MGSSAYNPLDDSQKDLEDVLVDVGRRLLRLPSSTDEILAVLRETELILAEVNQQPTKSMGEALFRAMMGLISDKLLRSSDVNIQIAVAACANELTRITAPDPPYNDEQMKVIFQLFMVTIKQLPGNSSRNFAKAMMILEVMLTVRSCVIMLDFECDPMVVELFQLFFDMAGSNVSSDVVKYMEDIIVVMIEESDEVSVELLKPILSNCRMDNKTTSPATWNMGKCVLERCATKLQPYLKEAVRSLNLDVSDYPKIVTFLCQDAPNANGGKMVGEKVAAVQSADNDLSCDVVSNSSGVPQADREDCNPQVEDENPNIRAENDTARSDTEVVKSVESGEQLETGKREFHRRRGRKPNSLIRPEEGYEHAWTGGGKDPKLGIRKRKDSSLLLESGKSDIPGDSSQKKIDSVNKGSGHKSGRSKNKEIVVNPESDHKTTENLRRKILISKLNERGSSKTRKATNKNAVSGEKAEGSQSGAESDKEDKLLQKDSEMKEIENGCAFEKREKRDAEEKVVESPILEPANDESLANPAPEKENKSGRRKVVYREELVNSRIMVWWPLDKTFYTGTVEAFDPSTKKHKIKYDDDEREELNLRKEKWELFEEHPQRVQPSIKQEQTDLPSLASEPVKTGKRIAKRKAGSSEKYGAASSSKRSKIVVVKSEDDVLENELSPMNSPRRTKRGRGRGRGRSSGRGRSNDNCNETEPVDVVSENESSPVTSLQKTKGGRGRGRGGGGGRGRGDATKPISIALK